MKQIEKKSDDERSISMTNMISDVTNHFSSNARRKKPINMNIQMAKTIPIETIQLLFYTTSVVNYDVQIPYSHI